MTRSVHVALLTVLLLGASATAQDEAPLRPEDFALGRTIELRTDAPLQTLLLDLSVYRGSVEPLLADLRVMNAAGEPVPHAVRRLTRPTRQEGDRVSLPFFELHPAPAPAGGTSVGLEVPGADPAAVRSYSIRAEVSESGAIVQVDSRPPASAAPPTDAPPPPAYLLDASQVEPAIERLELELASGDVGFVVPVRVEASNDLARFERVSEGSVIARLEEGGHRIEKRDVQLGAARHKYLRISWPSAPLPVRITAVRADLEPELEAPPRDRMRVVGRAIADEPGAFLFDLGGQLPVDRVQILLPESNTLVQARIYSATGETGPWRLRHSGLLYDLEYGENLRNPELTWPVERHRYVKLAIAPKSGGLGSGSPKLEAHWLSEQLLFITRGAPPYQLVYGRLGAPLPPFDPAEILKARRDPREEPPRATARLGDEYPLGDRSVLEREEAPPYRTWALWAVLLLAVGVVLGLSISLLRQMRSDRSD